MVLPAFLGDSGTGAAERKGGAGNILLKLAATAPPPAPAAVAPSVPFGAGDSADADAEDLGGRAFLAPASPRNPRAPPPPAAPPAGSENMSSFFWSNENSASFPGCP